MLPSRRPVRRFPRLLLGLLVLLGVLAAAPSAHAQARPAPRPAAPAAPARPVSDKVDLQVLVVHATDSYVGVDERIRGLESSFRYFRYKGYKLLGTQNAQVAPNDTANFAIAGGRKVRVTLMSMDEARARLHVEVLQGEARLFDTTVNINRGGTFIISGPKHEDGILMLPVRASY